MNISQKLFLSFLGLTTLVLFATLSLARWGFDQGFADFINALEKQRLESVAANLVDIYVEYDEDWSRVPPFEIVRLLSRSDDGFRNPPPHQRRGPAPLHAPPKQTAAPAFDKELERFNRPPNALVHTTLLDTEHTLLFNAPLPISGSKKNTTITDVVIEFNSQPIGILRSYHSKLDDSHIAGEFSQQQLMWSASVGGGCLLLAILLAYFLSKLLLDPIQTVLQSVAKLRSGDYDLNLSHHRKDELGQLMTDIESLSQTLNSTKRAKSRWIADISHELRTPLTVLVGEIDLIKSGVRPFDQKNLSSLEDEVKRLTRLVEDLYQLSVSDTGALRYQMTHIDIVPLLETVVAKKTLEFANKDISLSITNLIKSAKNVGVSIYADQQRVEQLFLNLLNNSLQYTDPIGALRIQLEVRSDTLIITFSDSAPTVSEAECEQLFEPLQRQDAARTRFTSGAGLGLTICRNIVHAHHGTIYAKPSVLGGIAITVSLPIKGSRM